MKRRERWEAGVRGQIGRSKVQQNRKQSQAGRDKKIKAQRASSGA